MEEQARAREAELAARQQQLEAAAQQREAELASRQSAADADAEKRETAWRMREAEMRTKHDAIAADIAERESAAKEREAVLQQRQAAAEAEALQLEVDCRKREESLAARQCALEEQARAREAELAARQQQLEAAAQQREAELASRQSAADADAERREKEWVERQEIVSEALVAALALDQSRKWALEDRERELLVLSREQESSLAKLEALDGELLRMRRELDVNTRCVGEKQQQLNDEMFHRTAGNQSAQALTHDLLKRNDALTKQLKSLFKTVTLLIEKKRVDCLRCCWENSMERDCCEFCALPLKRQLDV
ncbi:kinesin, putative [Bodo saltans]|uniref:Kinesin, putative n=1 Tax=Bodo saltans TaxID=75058 RepID=A0A0S4JFR6_BODSA|nr:kinesin, putative [Bodo saltans]|eukprot:CUG90328.1 kinesin, putative [Bodo saltans]